MEYKPKHKGAKAIGAEIEKGITDPAEIAKNTGYSVSTVKRYMGMYFPSIRKRTCRHKGAIISAKTQIIIDKLKAGEMQGNIARELNVSRQRVSDVKKRFLTKDEQAFADRSFMTSPIGDLPIDSIGLRKAIDEIIRLQDENSNLALTINTQNAELGLLRKGDLDRCGDINDDAVLESLKEMAVKAPNLHVNRVLGNAIRLILQLKDKNAELQKQVAELKEELEKAYEIERANIQAEIAEAGTSCHWCKNETVKDTAKEIASKVVDLNIICGDDFRLFLDNFELWVKERYGVEVE